MSDRIQKFVDYLLDTETTSNIVFNQDIKKNNELFHLRYRNDFEQVVNEKLQLWRNINRAEQSAAADNIIKNDGFAESSGTSSEEESSSEDEQKKPVPIEKVSIQAISSAPQFNAYVNIAGQCERLLQFLQYSQRHTSHMSDLYFRTLKQCVESENEKVVTAALQQILLHLSEDMDSIQNKHINLIKSLLSNMPSGTISETHKPILATIKLLLSPTRTENDMMTISGNNIEIIYPYFSCFLDVRREFRDSTHYFIDGDSFLLSMAHHINIDLVSFHGNTIHLIFLIERILLTLFNQAHQCNYTLVFFDCHYQIYQYQTPILDLLRSCLITHLCKNVNIYGTLKVRQFDSWLSSDYAIFVKDEKPMFMFYSDMSNLSNRTSPLLSESVLRQLVFVYRLFGNYHQYTIDCHLYLMNKLMLTDTLVQCFKIDFIRPCPMHLFRKVLQRVPLKFTSTTIEKKDRLSLEKLCHETAQGDVRLFLYLKSIMHLMKEKKEQKEVQLLNLLIPLLLLHVGLLIRLSLVDRHLPSSFTSDSFNPMFSELICQFQLRLSLSLSSNCSTLSWAKITDLFDGRLFAFTLKQINESSSNLRFDSCTFDMVKQSLNLLNIYSNKNEFVNPFEQIILSKNIIYMSSSSSKLAKQVTTSKEQHQQIAKISNPFIDTFLKPIISSKNDEFSIDFIDSNDCSRAQYQDRVTFLKTLFVFSYEYFTLYGKSLTSRDIKDSQMQITLPTASIPTSTSEETSVATINASGKKKKQSKEIHQTKAQKIIEENKKRQVDKLTAEETDKFTNIETRLQQIPRDNILEAIEFIDRHMIFFKTSVNRLKLLKQKFDLQRKYLNILRNQIVLANEDRSKLDLLEINYFATMAEITHLENVVDVFNEKKIYMEELVNDPQLDREKWYRFQLEKVNSRLPRCEQGVADSRTPDFIPDKWQIEFLDAVDKHQSIIIIAPTASGKTYASYYAMSKVLEKKDAICVYVAPTKALVNQVAATIYSKFGTVFGIFTRDFRMNMGTCRILVTVPQCFEILLISPTYQRWCKRIQYAIFDEIHCMSGELGSDVWERTMLLINCPMIGLSATVNNGDEIRQWIESIEQRRATLFQMSTPRSVCFIAHYERMADLNKYLYAERQLHPIHPVGLMNAEQLINRSLPKDFFMSPSETVRLSDAMQKTITNNTDIVNDDVEYKPVSTLTEYFSPAWIIERNACNHYSRLVCNQLNRLIMKKQNSAIDAITTSIHTADLSNIKYPEIKPMSSLIVEFVLTLKEKNLLPCIVFSDSRSICETMAKTVAAYFVKIERELRQTKYKKQIDQVKLRLQQIEKAEKMNLALIKSMKKTSSGKRRAKNEEDTDGGNNIYEKQMMLNDIISGTQLSGHEKALLCGILEEGTLANRHGYDEELVEPLLTRTEIENSMLVRLMRRGVAYHHAGLNNKGRVAVEALFRNRYIQIVFSTSTLAMGIHMPTKTVAFLQDSIFLDALQYRQSSGRAGRRGFDIEGHVVFIDIPLSKIRHLTISVIPNIEAHFPSSVTFLMRLLQLCSCAQDSKDAINRSLVALECPFILQSASKHVLVDIQIRFHCLHTLDFLHRLNLVNANGALIGLAGLSTHLHYFEPANILLVHLMDTRLFHEISDYSEIVIILAYVFTKKPWLITHKQFETLSLARREEMFNSKLFLPPISRDFRVRVELYNSIVKDVYGFYIENVTRRMRSFANGQEYVLPFSNISFTDQAVYDNGTFEYDLHHHRSQQTQNPSISPFAGPSGLTHEKYMLNYNSVVGSWDLAFNLDLSTRTVPFADLDCRDHTNSMYYLNSYALDFFNHGSEQLLEDENELQHGDIYNLLLDFNLVLSSIT
ncbi:unnamed protein product [Adineta steineri]|uniref:Uncharacterized protein n=1 Tax=Adineta steineri TaxID=433720 RepID=A0A813SH16_9BILA|nr:unnamed protein product [Adineta steineri]CAF0794475.1 unnamed protein product [Adineta steineri]